jgi:hypothetical protein
VSALHPAHPSFLVTGSREALGGDAGAWRPSPGVGARLCGGRASHRLGGVALCLVLLLLAAGCGRPLESKRAFYYWRTTFTLSEREHAALRDHRVTRLLVRFFDVAIDTNTGRAVPIGRISFRDRVPANVEVVAVVFLANQVFQASSAADGLASRVWTLVSSLAREGGISVSEVQVDCDWSDSTRDAFFAFCRELRAQGTGQLRLSATIRLHQVKYRNRTGVPPVDRGTLMFYNVGRLGAESGRCSIFNAEDAARYVPFLDRYPVPLDVALAIFSWVVHARDGRIVGLLEKTEAAALDASGFLRRTAPQRWLVAEPAFFRGTYLKAGDTLTLEAATPVVTHQAASMLAGRLRPDAGFTLALFDLDERNLAAYPNAELEAVFSALP